MISRVHPGLWGCKQPESNFEMLKIKHQNEQTRHFGGSPKVAWKRIVDPLKTLVRAYT